MKNKFSYRLFAWLLAIIMVLNVAPVSAFAELNDPGTNQVDPQNEKSSPPVEKDPITGLSVVGQVVSDSVPNNTETFTVRIVVKGDYTYNGKDLVYKSVPGRSGNPSTYNPKDDQGLGLGNLDDMFSGGFETRTWDKENKILTFYPTLHTAPTIDIHYDLLYQNENGEWVAETFQQLENGKAGLIRQYANSAIGAEDINEKLEFKEFNGKKDNASIDTFNDVSIKRILPFTIPNTYFDLDGTYYSTLGRPFQVGFYGSNYGVDQVKNGNIILVDNLNKEKPIFFDYFANNKQNKIDLYYTVKAAPESSEKYTINFVNDDGTVLQTEQLPKGYLPIYKAQTPTKESTVEGTYYEFSDWDKEIVPVTADTTYVATYEKTNEAPVTNTYKIRYVLKDTDTDIQKPLKNQAYEAWDVPTAVITPNAHQIEGYKIYGYSRDGKDIYAFKADWELNNGIQSAKSQLKNDTFIFYYESNAPQTVTVSFNSNGGSAVSAQTINKGTTATEPTAPTKDGHTFQKWQLNGNDFSFSTAVNENITLDAVWTINSYKVTYSYTDEKVPTGAPAVPAEATYAYGATVRAATVPSLIGYTFHGWTGRPCPPRMWKSRVTGRSTAMT